MFDIFKFLKLINDLAFESDFSNPQSFSNGWTILILIFIARMIVSVIIIIKAFMSLSLGAVVIRSDNVWPMIRIYRGGFLLIEFLFLLGTFMQGPKYLCLWGLVMSLLLVDKKVCLEYIFYMALCFTSTGGVKQAQTPRKSVSK